MKRNYYLILIILIVGCASVEKIIENYEKITYSNGINEKEAVIIAQMNLLKSKGGKNFEIYNPIVYSHKEVEKYPNFWFILFIANNPDEDVLYHMVVVDKNSGGIIRSRNYRRERFDGVDWIFE